jgi:hypothetical protein
MRREADEAETPEMNRFAMSKFATRNDRESAILAALEKAEAENAAREALTNGAEETMIYTDGICSYCKATVCEELPKFLAIAAMQQHAKTCPDHPARELERKLAETAAYAGGLEAFVVAARRVAGYLTAKEPIDYIRDGEAWNARARFLQLLKQAEDARAALAAKPVAEPRQIGTSGKGESAEGGSP